MIDDWWLYPTIAAWSVFLDSATLLSTCGTLRFAWCPTGLVFLITRAVVALMAGLLLPVLLTEEFDLTGRPLIVAFVSPMVSISVLEVLLGRLSQSPGDYRTDIPGLLAQLKDKTVEDARRRADEARQSKDVKVAAGLAGSNDAEALRQMLLNLLHMKLPTITDACERLKLLTAGMSDSEEMLRDELATEIVKIDRRYAVEMLRRSRRARPRG